MGEATAGANPLSFLLSEREQRVWYLGKEEYIAVEEKNGDEVVELFSQTVAASHTCRRSC